MESESFLELKEKFTLELVQDSPDFQKLALLFSDLEKYLLEQQSSLGMNDWLVIQAWLTDIIPQFEELKSKLAGELGQLQQGLKAREYYQS